MCKSWTVLLATLLTGSGLLAAASEMDEFKVKRQEVFEFAQKPLVMRQGDRIEVSFESKGACDVTVAVEDPNGKIIRHLASGVLGPNAPEPLQKNSLKQTLVWDSKNDQGKYIDDKDSHTIRVSLGLKPKFEKSLYYSPKKRIGALPAFSAAPEGMYVYDGYFVDFVRLFDHEGKYLRTVYPFPANKLKEVQGLDWKDLPQGFNLPLKQGPFQSTFLTSGTNGRPLNKDLGVDKAASAMAVQGNRIALAYNNLNRLSTDGSTGGLPLEGPKTGVLARVGALADGVGPASLAFSPDGKRLYMTGYLWYLLPSWPYAGSAHAVLRMDYESNEPPKLFAGSLKFEHNNDEKLRGPDEVGSDDAHFKVPTSVACDAQERVYVSDFYNDRVQVFDASAKLLRSLPVPRPAKVVLNKKTGEIYVFSFAVVGVPNHMAKALKGPDSSTLTRFSAFPEAKNLGTEPFPIGAYDNPGSGTRGHLCEVEVDSWAEQPTVWIVSRKHRASQADISLHWMYAKTDSDPKLWENGVCILRKTDGAWKAVHQFAAEAIKEVVHVAPPRHNIQHCYVHPLTGKLYLAETDCSPVGKGFNQWIEIDPDSGKIRELQMPFGAIDAAFDLDGMLYLRDTNRVVRYTFEQPWREVPWDYGEEHKDVGHGAIGERVTQAISALPLPSLHPVCYHQGGMHVSPKGNLVVSCSYQFGATEDVRAANQIKGPDAYRPKVYPGRYMSNTGPCIHIWDKHGKLVYEDVVPGAAQVDGVYIDREDSVYFMHSPNRVIEGKAYFNEFSETLVKVRPKQAKVLCTGNTPIPMGAEHPKRAPDGIRNGHGGNGQVWMEGADWQYGGVGHNAFNSVGLWCNCWFSRFTLDYFARSIVPEPDLYRVGVVDSNGNLILHIGQYGNADSNGPGSLVPLGGDEVGLMSTWFVGTQTDRRIFIADIGNARIVSVKLDYHASERVPLKTAPEQGK